MIGWTTDTAFAVVALALRPPFDMRSWTPLPRAAAGAIVLCLSLVASATPGSAQSVAEPPTPTLTPTVTATPSASATPTATATLTSMAATLTPTPLVFQSSVPCATGDPHAVNGVFRSERYGDPAWDEIQQDDEFLTGNGRNRVITHNCTDQQLRVRANIQLNSIPGSKVTPANEAYAESSCVDCQTLAVALQLNVYRPDKARDIQPVNLATAINSSCTRCATVAVAIQYSEGVEDAQHIPDDVRDTAAAIEDELRSIQTDPTIGLPEAVARLDAAITRFEALPGQVVQTRDQRDD